eukprot:3858218-Rhodomonas_salina.1
MLKPLPSVIRSKSYPHTRAASARKFLRQTIEHGACNMPKPSNTECTVPVCITEFKPYGASRTVNVCCSISQRPRSAAHQASICLLHAAPPHFSFSSSHTPTSLPSPLTLSLILTSPSLPPFLTSPRSHQPSDALDVERDGRVAFDARHLGLRHHKLPPILRSTRFRVRCWAVGESGAKGVRRVRCAGLAAVCEEMRRAREEVVRRASVRVDGVTRQGGVLRVRG